MPRNFALKVLRFFIRLLAAIVIVSLFFVVTQDFHIFPGLYTSLLFGAGVAPPGVEVLRTVAADGKAVTVWRVKADKPSNLPPALLFHGNAENLAQFMHMQTWLKSLGVTSYAVEYRGYGGWASGWPSEGGFYSDAEAAFKLLKQQEGKESKDIMVLGSSIGTGTAAYVAQKYNVGTLVLLSPYSSLSDVVSETPFFGYLARFLKYRFPTIEYIRNLSDTCVIAAHGRQDGTIPFHHSEILKDSYRGKRTFSLIASDQAGHNDILRYTRDQVAASIVRCLKQGGSNTKSAPQLAFLECKPPLAESQHIFI